MQAVRWILSEHSYSYGSADEPVFHFFHPLVAVVDSMVAISSGGEGVEPVDEVVDFGFISAVTSNFASMSLAPPDAHEVR